MKKHFFFLIVFVSLLSSCSIDDNNSLNFYLEILPIDSVDMPETFVHGEIYEISMTYTQQSDCYRFNDFIYDVNENERTVAIVNTVYFGADMNCIEEQQSATASFDFIVNETEPYVFKFYQGENEDGVDQYYIVEVPVVVD
jgi:hypothetical protein